MGIGTYIKEIGRGKDGARALTRAQAADLFGQVLDATVTELEIGAFCLAMRIKGETPQEMAGFLDATHQRLQRIPAAGQAASQPTIVIPSYNGARKLPVLTPLLALLLAREGLPVLIHGTATESSIQNHPLRDLVTPRNPRSRYTFVNFLFENNRLYEHLNLPLAHPLRLEYRQYVTWVANHFAEHVRYSSNVHAITPIRDNGTITAYEVSYNDGEKLLAKSIVLAPGRTPHIPPEFHAVDDSRVVHLTQFLGAFKEVKRMVAHPRIAIVGGSQTAVELLLHVANNLPVGEVIGINRNFGFRLKDTSPFSDEVYFPEFVDTFFHATRENKDRLRKELVFTNYSASDRDVLDALYVHMYRNKIQNKNELKLKHLTTITNVDQEENAIQLTLTHSINGTMEIVPFDLVVLATGFKDLGDSPQNEPYPRLLASLANDLEIAHGAMTVELDYRVKFMSEQHAAHAPLFLNGLCESSHGMGDAGSFSLLSLRSATIVNSLQNHFSSAHANRKHIVDCTKAGVQSQSQMSLGA